MAVLAISFIGAGSVASSTSLASMNVSSNTNTQIGDLLIMFVTSNTTNTGNFNPNLTGWTRIADRDSQLSSPGTTIYYRFSDVRGATTVSLGVTSDPGATVRRKAVIVTYRGASGVDVVSTVSSGSGTTITYPNVTTTYSNDFVLCLGALGSGGTRTAGTPTGTTSRVGSAAGTSATGLYIFDELQAAAGLTTSRTGSASSGSSWASIRLAISPGRQLYWVGGSGTINSGTRWALTSGGTGTVTTTSAADELNYDANSGASPFTVTLPSATTLLANDIIIGGLSASMTLALAATSSNIFLNNTIALPATNFAFSGAGGDLTFSGPSNVTLTTNGVTLPFNRILIDKTVNNRGVTLGSSLTTTAIIEYITGSNFNTSASNFSVTASGFDYTQGSLGTTSVVTLNSSTLNLTGYGWTASVATTILTVSAANATLILSGSNTSFAARGIVTYGSVTFTENVSRAVFTIAGDSGDVVTITNLTLNPPATPGFNEVDFNSTGALTVTNFSSVGVNGSRRIYINGGGVEVRIVNRTIVDTDFSAVIQSSTEPSLSGTRLGNFGFNSRITFPAAKTVYWNLPAGGNWQTDTGWAATSGGTPALANYPLRQDTVVIDDTGLSTGNTLTISGRMYLPNTVTSTKTNAWTWATGTLDIYGGTSQTLTNFASQTGAGTWFYGGCTISNNNANFQANFNFSGIATTVTIPTTLRTTGIVTSTLDSFSSLNINSGGGATLQCASITHSGNISSNSTVVVTGNGNVASFTYGSISNNFFLQVADTSSSTKSMSSSTPGRCSVIFLGGSGNANINGTMRNITFNSGFTGNADGALVGNLTLASGMTSGSFTFIGFSGVSGGIVTNGATISSITINNTTPANNVSLTGSLILTSSLIQSGGTFNTNGNTITASNVTVGGSSTFNASSNTIVLTGTAAATLWSCSSSATLNSMGTISFAATTSSPRTFVGGGKSYGTFNLGGQGTGTIVIAGSNTFNTLTTNNTTSPFTVQFTASTTQTITNWALNGTASNTVSLRSTAAAQYTLSKSTGTVTAEYLDIQFSDAQGGATWIASNSINSGNNAGWIFGTPGGSSNFFLLF